MNFKEYFEQRKQRKARIVDEVKRAKALEKTNKEALNALSKDEKASRIKQEKIARKHAKNAHKQDLKAMERKEKRTQKKEDKIYKKVYNRPRRALKWGVVVIIFAFITVQYGPTINNLYRAVTSKDVSANTSTPEAIAARLHGEKVSEEIVEEGIVLLKNEDHSLPFSSTDKVNVFGTAAHEIRYGGGGSGASNDTHAIDLFEAFDQVGLEYNKDLADFYKEKSSGGSSGSGLFEVVKGLLGKTSIDEPTIDHLSDEVLTQAKAYSNKAVIVISSSGTEASDFSLDQLKLSDNRRALIEKVAENFSDVTIIINAGNAIELGFIEEYDTIKSAVWIGTPGPFGTRALANILMGNINPSGRLTSTYAYDPSSSPASVNFGDFQYDNTKFAFINYEEGIYVGYRFYETYYLGNEEGYAKAVQYPFGYGLSYTNFDWNIVSTDLNKDTITVNVEVVNTGDVAGKDVVQAYYSAPYYEGGIEKSAINLVTYGKTQTLEPGARETLTLTFDVRDMASYDMNDLEAYVLEHGLYTIKLGRNVHDIAQSVEYTVEETVVYQTDKDTQVAYENRFEYANGALTYLSRNDWENTFPTLDNLNTTASDILLEALSAPRVAPEGSKNETFGEDHGLKLEDLKGLDYDDETWDLFLSQFTANELIELVTNGAYKTVGIERLGVPQTLLMDGPAGFSYFFGSLDTAGYPSEILVSSTWNQELAYTMGEAIGREGVAYGIQGWYAPAMNLHRTAQGGRNFEYFSEDPILSGYTSANMTKGSEDQGVIVFMKHFMMNDQETNARSGITVWSNEQAIRELYLKPFEITVKEGGATGAMSSFSLIGTTWAGANTNLLQDILREEWGFVGMVSSDAVFGFMKAEDAIISGNDLMLDILTPKLQERSLKKSFKSNPELYGTGLKQSAHNIFYAILQTYIFD
ncbi:hypothetical protein AOC36_02150 [Erysipelothrix larvae]|uniref:Fibronectin type III-like domain-containing protein n=1 Tax=Erysipelothrix larvae TaxID=1514105 RepID=A0A0X8GYM9_9FIRM|nr:glycoside hydrolase family 3 C-terminal domain-containing protein [Erysipelothrix larvae]AMC92827.1 hypothetical protein AOC36_02150 [Erysipelothrix larvae]